MPIISNYQVSLRDCRSSGNFQYQPYSSQYNQSYGTTQYQTAAASTPTRSGAAGTDNSDLATLNDALGSAGVDLRVRLPFSEKIS